MITAADADRAESGDAVAPVATPVRRRFPHPRDVLVWILGAAGAIAIAWLVASWAFGLQLVILTTGSMSPDLPAGSAVVAHTVDASELEVGDIVSVPRAYDGQTVTHRIVDISNGAGSAERELTLRGDANDTADVETYTVTQARSMLVGVPGLGSVALFLSSPAGITTLAVVLPLAALWVLWPSRR